MQDDDNKPGPSGYQKKEDKKDKRKATRSAENRKHQHRTKKPRQHVQIAYEKPSRYKLPAREERTQVSHSVKKFVATPVSTPKVREKQTRLVLHEPELARRSHHHLDAVDYYYRSTKYGNRHKDDIEHLKQKHAYPKDRVKPIQPSHRHRNVCKNCLEPISNCICILGIERPPKSDWAVILSHRLTVPPWGFQQSRLEWLEKLERENEKIDIDKLAKKKFHIHNEICCFPFTTFWFFYKSDIECFDYYRRENNKKEKLP
jgi:hypothetical protein